jgi:hypothetical protein
MVRRRWSSVLGKKVVGPWSLAKPDSWRRVLLGSFCWILFLGYTWLQFLIHSQRAVSKVDRFTLRRVVSQYTLDYQRSPRSFSELKIAGYLNFVPPRVDERDVFFQVPEIQDPPLEILLPNFSDAGHSHHMARLPDFG